jgi:hypothetical protein
MCIENVPMCKCADVRILFDRFSKQVVNELKSDKSKS